MNRDGDEKRIWKLNHHEIITDENPNGRFVQKNDISKETIKNNIEKIRLN